MKRDRMLKVCWPKIFHIGFGILYCATELQAQSGVSDLLGNSPVAKQLQDIEQAVKDGEEKLAVLKIDLARLEGENKKNDAQIYQLKQEEAKLVKESGDVATETQGVASERQALRTEIDQRKTRIVQRVRATYQARPENVQAFLFSGRLRDANSLSESKVALYLARITKHDHRVFEQFLSAEKSLQGREQKLRLLTETLTQYRTKIKEKRDQLVDSAKTQERLALEIRKQRQEEEKKVASLRAQALRMETVVRTLAQGSREQFPSPAVTPSRPSQEVKSRGPGPLGQGVGIRVLKGKMQFPAPGKVIRPFGQVRRLGFGDLVRSKGLSIEVTPRSEVKAVAPGRVAFVGEVPGYKLMVMIDHGERSVSVYGLLQRAEVTVGEEVRMGEIIGSAGELQEESEPNLYFELRVADLAIDPKGYFKGY